MLSRQDWFFRSNCFFEIPYTVFNLDNWQAICINFFTNEPYGVVEGTTNEIYHKSTFTEFTLHKPTWLQLTLYTTDSRNTSTEGVYMTLQFYLFHQRIPFWIATFSPGKMMSYNCVTIVFEFNRCEHVQSNSLETFFKNIIHKCPPTRPYNTKIN